MSADNRHLVLALGLVLGLGRVPSVPEVDLVPGWYWQRLQDDGLLQERTDHSGTYIGITRAGRAKLREVMA